MSGRRRGRDGIAAGSTGGERAKAVRGCGDGSIELLEVQLEGKKRMAAAAFLNGNRDRSG